MHTHLIWLKPITAAGCQVVRDAAQRGVSQPQRAAAITARQRDVQLGVEWAEGAHNQPVRRGYVVVVTGRGGCSLGPYIAGRGR